MRLICVSSCSLTLGRIHARWLKRIRLNVRRSEVIYAAYQPLPGFVLYQADVEGEAAADGAGHVEADDGDVAVVIELAGGKARQGSVALPDGVRGGREGLLRFVRLEVGSEQGICR